MTPQIEQVGYSVRGLANWILDYSQSKGASQTNMSINKLVYFAVAHVLVRRGRLLTRAKMEAWNHGPVFRELYQDFRKHGDDAISSRAEAFSLTTGTKQRALVVLTREDEADVIDAIQGLIHLPACVLRDLSHARGGAWDRVWSYEGYANPGMEITPGLILEAAGEEGAQ